MFIKPVQFCENILFNMLQCIFRARFENLINSLWRKKFNLCVINWICLTPWQQYSFIKPTIKLYGNIVSKLRFWKLFQKLKRQEHFIKEMSIWIKISKSLQFNENIFAQYVAQHII